MNKALIRGSIDLNHERAAKRKVAYENTDMEYRKALNEKYSIIGLLEMDQDSITIRCHVSDQAMNRINLPRVQRIEIK